MTKKSSSSKDMEKDFLIDSLKKENKELKKHVAKLEKTLNSYDIDEIEEVSDIEYICIEEIKKLRHLSDAGGLSDIDVKNLDTLHKNLRQIRKEGLEKKKPKEADSSVEELLSIVNNGEN